MNNKIRRMHGQSEERDPCREKMKVYFFDHKILDKIIPFSSFKSMNIWKFRDKSKRPLYYRNV